MPVLCAGVCVWLWMWVWMCVWMCGFLFHVLLIRMRDSSQVVRWTCLQCDWLSRNFLIWGRSSNHQKATKWFFPLVKVSINFPVMQLTMQYSRLYQNSKNIALTSPKYYRNEKEKCIVEHRCKNEVLLSNTAFEPDKFSELQKVCIPYFKEFNFCVCFLIPSPVREIRWWSNALNFYLEVH